MKYLRKQDMVKTSDRLENGCIQFPMDFDARVVISTRPTL